MFTVQDIKVHGWTILAESSGSQPEQLTCFPNLRQLREIPYPPFCGALHPLWEIELGAWTERCPGAFRNPNHIYIPSPERYQISLHCKQIGALQEASSCSQWIDIPGEIIIVNFSYDNVWLFFSSWIFCVVLIKVQPNIHPCFTDICYI